MKHIYRKLKNPVFEFFFFVEEPCFVEMIFWSDSEQDFAYSGFGGRGGKHGDIFWDNESYAIKRYMKMFAELASATLKQVADWFVWLASTLGRFNANELRRADHEVHDIADGRYDGRIQKFQ